MLDNAMLKDVAGKIVPFGLPAFRGDRWVSAYFIGGFGMTALTANNIVLVPIRYGIGLGLGANIGYLKFTPRATWNPF